MAYRRQGKIRDSHARRIATHSFGARLERHRSNAASEIGGGFGGLTAKSKYLYLAPYCLAPRHLLPATRSRCAALASTGRQPRRLSADATSLPPPVLWLVRSAFLLRRHCSSFLQVDFHWVRPVHFKLPFVSFCLAVAFIPTCLKIQVVPCPPSIHGTRTAVPA